MSDSRCSNCQSKIEDSYNYCPVCGTMITELVADGSFGPVLIPRNSTIPATPDMVRKFVKNPEEKPDKNS